MLQIEEEHYTVIYLKETVRTEEVEKEDEKNFYPTLQFLFQKFTEIVQFMTTPNKTIQQLDRATICYQICFNNLRDLLIEPIKLNLESLIIVDELTKIIDCLKIGNEITFRLGISR